MYRKSRRFHGNQHSNKAKKKTTDRKSSVTEDARKSTISGKKIMDISAPKYTQNIDGYRLVDMSILDNIINKLLCPSCQGFGLHTSEDNEEVCLHPFISNVQNVNILMKVIPLQLLKVMLVHLEGIHLM